MPDGENYTGILGLFQRDLADVSLYSIRTDQVVGEPVIVGPAIGSADVVMMSLMPPSLSHGVDVCDSFSAFDALLYSFLMLLVIIVALTTSAFLIALSPVLN